MNKYTVNCIFVTKFEFKFGFEFKFKLEFKFELSLYLGKESKLTCYLVHNADNDDNNDNDNTNAIVDSHTLKGDW